MDICPMTENVKHDRIKGINDELKSKLKRKETVNGGLEEDALSIYLDLTINR